jgi:hypothetical protein
MLVERQLERRAAMARGAEGDALRRTRRIGNAGEVRRHELADVDEEATGRACRRAG